MVLISRFEIQDEIKKLARMTSAIDASEIVIPD